MLMKSLLRKKEVGRIFSIVVDQMYYLIVTIINGYSF